MINEQEVDRLMVLIGEQGEDWQEYVTCPEYWNVWGWLNRN